MSAVRQPPELPESAWLLIGSLAFIVAYAFARAAQAVTGLR